MNASKHLMVVKITSIDHNKEWYIVNIYAPNTKNLRKKIWDTLSHIKSNDYFGRWIIVGDFNVLLYDHEKKGGNVSQLEGRLDLMDFINKEGLMDMDLHGIQFTWHSKRICKDCI